MTTCWRPGFISTIATWRTGRCWSFPAPKKARSTITMPAAISSAHGSGDRGARLCRSGTADRQGRVDDHPPCPPRARLGAQHLLEAAPAAVARVYGGRCLAADGRRQFRRIQRPHGAGQADDRAAPHVGSGPHAAAAGAVPGLDLREPARGRQALLRHHGAIAAEQLALFTLPPNPGVPGFGNLAWSTSEI